MPRCRPSMPHWRRSDEHPDYSHRRVVPAPAFATRRHSPPNSRCRATAGRAGRSTPSKARRTGVAGAAGTIATRSRTACRLDDDRGNFGTPRPRDDRRRASVCAPRRRQGRARARVVGDLPGGSHDADSRSRQRGRGRQRALADRAVQAAAATRSSAMISARTCWPRSRCIAAISRSNALVAIARGDGRAETRKKAVFWLAHAARHRRRRGRDLRDVQRQGSRRCASTRPSRSRNPNRRASRRI